MLILCCIGSNTDLGKYQRWVTFHSVRNWKQKWNLYSLVRFQGGSDVSAILQKCKHVGTSLLRVFVYTLRDRCRWVLIERPFEWAVTSLPTEIVQTVAEENYQFFLPHISHLHLTSPHLLVTISNVILTINLSYSWNMALLFWQNLVCFLSPSTCTNLHAFDVSSMVYQKHMFRGRETYEVLTEQWQYQIKIDVMSIFIWKKKILNRVLTWSLLQIGYLVIWMVITWAPLSTQCTKITLHKLHAVE